MSFNLINSFLVPSTEQYHLNRSRRLIHCLFFVCYSDFFELQLPRTFLYCLIFIAVILFFNGNEWWFL